ncbi:hypothetical protein ABEB36_002397 [Hypothenemus hampei]|uniref:Uncharacterized protein n=1 Tax=Hypothenemus hampei TaxID=57062 RepID=A0ABD1F5K9_HYPHA
MDNPGLSLFQGADLQLNNSNNIEEEEDLEDQLRRKEELQNLLQANLDDFNFEDSTINTSTNVSIVSAENLEQVYKEAITPHEQLKVLYDVKCREIQTLKDEYEKLKAEKNKEIELVKNQKLLMESELRQVQISLKNAENLLVGEKESYHTLEKKLREKESENEKFKELINDYENNLEAYKTEVTELTLKLSQNGLFNLDAKYNSEELKNSLQTKINHLENLLEENTKKLEICTNEKQSLQEEVQRIISDKAIIEEENNLILANFESAQQQCKDLISVIEMLKQENDHFKARLSESLQGNNCDESNRNAKESDSAGKLKRMLVDKSVELNTLKTQLRYYENDIKELIEYRQLKCDVWKKDFQKCDNRSHTKDLLLMQNELQNYKTLIDDKNRQILLLTSNNTDLKEKIEEMLLQTRNEIQNISSKYNMPKLQLMSKELEKAETAGKILTKKLEESEQRRLSLLQKLENQCKPTESEELLEELRKCRDDLKATAKLLDKEQDQNRMIAAELEYKKNELFQLKSELEHLKIEMRKYKNNKEEVSNDNSVNVKTDYEILREQLKNVMHYLEDNSKSKKSLGATLEIQEQMDKFLRNIEDKVVKKGIIEDQINLWKKMLEQIVEPDHDGVLEAQYSEKIQKLENQIADLQKLLLLSQRERDNKNMELQDTQKQIVNNEKLKISLEREIEQLKSVLQNRDDELASLKRLEQPETTRSKRVENLEIELKETKANLIEKKNALAIALKSIQQHEQENKETTKQNYKEIDRLKRENEKITEAIRQQEVSIVKDEFEVKLQQEVVNRELKLREELQKDFQKRLKEIETQYQKSFKGATDMCKKQKLQIEEQDKKFREYLKVILTECESCTVTLEKEKQELLKEMDLLKTEFNNYKTSALAKEKTYQTSLRMLEIDFQKINEKWKDYSKNIISRCLEIESMERKVRDKVIATDKYDQEIELLRKHMDAKLTKRHSRKDKS